MRSNLKIAVLRFLRYRFNLDSDKADEKEIIENVRKGIEFKGINLWTLIFAIFIASIGLNINSSTVVIGAMLISPLMGPVIGIGVGAGIFDFQFIKKSAKNLAIAASISLLTSALYFAISPLSSAQSEILSFTKPTIWDVLIAFLGGMAAIIAGSRKNFTSVILGASIAISLIPPLCTVGYGLGTGHYSYCIGAFYMFIINCVFISIATFIIIRFLKFKPAQLVDTATQSKMKKVIWTFAILTILPSLYLAYQFVGQEIFKQKMQQFISSEIKQDELFILSQSIDPAKESAHLIIYAANTKTDSLLHAINQNKNRYGLEKATLSIKFTQNENVGSKTQPGANQDLINSLYAKQTKDIAEKNKKIDSLTTILTRFQENDFNTSAMHNEFNALFGATKELAFFKNLYTTKDGKNNTTLYVIYTPEKGHKANQKQMESWLKAKTNLQSIKIIERSK